MPGEVLDLLRLLVSVRTVNDPLAGRFVGEAEVGEVREILQGFGLETDMIDFDGSPALVAVRGRGRPVTLVMAHLDVVPPGPGWSSDPFELTVRGDRAYGRGAADDKGNVAAITLALGDYEPGRGTLVIAFTSDEEIGGAKGARGLREWLKSRGLWPDYLINGDGFLSSVIVRRRAVFTARVRVKGSMVSARGCRESRTFRASVRQRQTMHAAYFTPGVDTHPLIEASLWTIVNDAWAVRISGAWVKSNVVPSEVTLDSVAGECDEYHAADDGLTRLLRAILPLTRPPIAVDLYSDYGVTVTPNVYRERGGWHEVVLDIRAMTTDLGSVRRALEDVASVALEGAEYSIEVGGGEGYLYTSPSSRLVTEALSVNKMLGLSGRPVEAAGASDSRYFSPHGVEAIDYGPLGGGVHGPDEFVVISHLHKAVRFYRLLAERIHG